VPSIVTPPQSPLADVTAAHSGSRRFLRLLVFASLFVVDFSGCSFSQSKIAGGQACRIVVCTGHRRHQSTAGTFLSCGRKWKSDEVICGLGICRKQELGSEIEFGVVLDVKVNVMAEFAIEFGVLSLLELHIKIVVLAKFEAIEIDGIIAWKNFASNLGWIFANLRFNQVELSRKYGIVALEISKKINCWMYLLGCVVHFRFVNPYVSIVFS